MASSEIMPITICLTGGLSTKARADLAMDAPFGRAAGEREYVTTMAHCLRDWRRTHARGYAALDLMFRFFAKVDWRICEFGLEP